ncbi:MAG TPA: response regulator [Thermoanaerobaculia bacterium]|nr:response regulator [Thermoanaerobaculia bacterium]
MSIRARRVPNRARKLLVIDDDDKLLASYRDLLTPYGFEVLCAQNGEEAITLVHDHPDILLVLLDLAMPKMDGHTWLKWFRAERNESPVIVITAYQLQEADLELQPAAVIEKPFHVAELLDLVGLFCGLGTPLAARAT